MIETSMLGDAVGVQYQGVIDKSESTNLPALSNGVIVGRFKRGIIGRVFTVTSDTYRTLLGHDLSNPSYMAVADVFSRDVSEVKVLRVGATGKVTVPPVVVPDIPWTDLVPSTPIVPDNKSARVIISGTAKAGETLTATVSDENGLPNDITYQWLADGAPISGATAKNYVLKVDQVDKVITATASFTDNDGYAESAISSDTLPVESASPISRNNDIGVQGTANFGIGVTDVLPVGMSEMAGTTELGHANYGNYKYSDGSMMCWIPLFYYRWGGADSPYAAKYGLNSCDVKSKHDFVDVAAANAAGYALHRAFYDEGQIKDGFFVDKYKCTNKSNKASSIKGWSPITVDEYNYVLSGISDFSNNSIVIAKTRGEDFFVSTIFIQRALSLLSMAHAQASTSNSACAWYDATGIANYPKGANNVLRDFNDTTVTYKATIGTNNPLTGTATPFAKTTHNGQTNGVADLNGIRSELVLGLTQLAGKYYVLKTSVKASELQKGVTLPTDAWGAQGIAANYELLGTKYESLTGSTLNKRMGNGDNQVFSSAVTGKGWQAACAGIPLLTGVSDESVDSSTVFGKDLFADIRIDNVYPLVGGSTSDKAIAGIWYTHLVIPFSDRGSHAFRSALYNA